MQMIFPRKSQIVARVAIHARRALAYGFLAYTAVTLLD
jgi:hypothetical protein